MVVERHYQLARDNNEEKEEKKIKTFPVPSFLIKPSHCVIEIHNESASLQFIHTK